MRRLPFVVVAVAVLAVRQGGNSPAAGPPARSVAIVHVKRGCHVWSVSGKRSPDLRLLIRRGSTLTVLNHDLDMHRLVQVAGPTIETGPSMGRHERVLLRFRKSGHYAFRTRVADMPGMPEVETIGPDNALVLAIHVS
jgi:hypothetical protein